jgi:Na+-translocating ferredoxin:NAD+ oxidoreductase RnfC subunit
MKRIFKGELSSEDLEKYDCAYLCCDCGLCELYGCMMDLSPRSLFNYIKSELERMGIKNSHNRSDLEVNEFREYRKVPVDRLEKRLEIDMYDSKTPLTDFSADVDEVKLYLSQHAGIPAEPVVKVGDSVKTGDLIADIPEGKLGAKIHSSISGKVKQLNSEYVLIERF